MTQKISDTDELFDKQSLLRLIFPLIVEQMLAITVGVADTVMVAGVGEAAVSGISLVDSMNMLFIQIFAALATGGAVITSQYLGRRQRDNACVAAKQLVYAITLLASAIMVVAIVFRYPILHTVFGNIEADVMSNAETYFFLSALSYPFLAVYNAGAALFRSMGNSKVSMFTSLIMNIVNITGNAILIFVFNWGVAGAATASLVSRALAAAIMVVLTANKQNTIYVDKLHKFEFRPDMVRNILKIGIPNGLENGMFHIGKLLVQSLIATFGTAAIAANAICNSIASMANIPGSAIGLSLITVVGQCIGGKEYDQAVGYTRKLMKAAMLSMGVISVIIFLLTGPLVGMFNLSSEATVMSEDILHIFCLFCPVLWPLSFTTPNALRAAGDARFTMVVSMLSMWIFRIGFSYFLSLGFNMGLMGVWYAMFIDWIARAVVFTLRFERGSWKRIKVI